MMLNQAKLYGIIGSALFCLLTFLLLWFLLMPAITRPAEEEGILVSFGEAMDGAGVGEVLAGAKDVAAASPAAPPVAPTKEKLMAQNTEKTVAVSQKQETKKQPPTVSNEERLRQEAEKRAAATAQRQREVAAQSENLVGGAFGNTGSGSGTTGGDTRQGNPAGSGSSGGHGWSLSGRSLVGSLATPDYASNVEGKITVNIRVDAAGRVTAATIGSPTTISEAETRNAAIRAARSTRFSSGSGVSMGTITYNFRLK